MHIKRRLWISLPPVHSEQDTSRSFVTSQIVPIFPDNAFLKAEDCDYWRDKV